MPVDMYMQIDGIKGDSHDSKHKEWIEVLSYQHGIVQATGGSSSAQGYMTGGRADHQDFTFTKRMDSGTPNLHKYVCDGKHIAKITFECCRAMGDKTTFMKVLMEDCIVCSVTSTGSASGDDLIPTEEVKLRYSKINWEYTPTDNKGGKTGAALKAGWSTMENKAV